jgi:hypothetical protein
LVEREKWLRRGAVAVAFTVILLVTFAGTFSVLSSEWTLFIIDPVRGDPQAEAALAVDSGSNLYVAYDGRSEGQSGSESVLKLASNLGGRWSSEVVESSVKAPRYRDGAFYDPSVAVDSAGHVHIAYAIDNGTYWNSIRYATNANGSWTLATIHTLATTYSTGSEFSPSIAVDSHGVAHIAFLWSRGAPDLECCYHLEYATDAGGVWTNSTLLAVPYDQVRHCAIALDSQGHVFIGVARLSAAGGVAVVTNADGGWSVHRTGDTGEIVGGGIAISTDSADHIHMAYPVDSSGTGNMTGRIHYATFVSGVGTVTQLPGDADTRSAVSLHLDRANRAHITYSEAGGNLVYATGSPGNWTTIRFPFAHPGDWWNPETGGAVPGQGSRVHIVFTQSRNYPEPTGLFYLSNGVDSTNAEAFWGRALPVLYIEGAIFVVAGVFIMALPRVVRRMKQTTYQ